MRDSKVLVAALAGVLLIGASNAWAHVFRPPNCPSGTGSQGSRVAGAQSDGTKVTLFGNAGSTGDTSVHYLFCFDEGLDSETPASEVGGDLPKGKSTSTGAAAIPSGAKRVHYVIYFDKDDVNTWATDGWVTL